MQLLHCSSGTTLHVCVCVCLVQIGSLNERLPSEEGLGGFPRHGAYPHGAHLLVFGTLACLWHTCLSLAPSVINLCWVHSNLLLCAVQRAPLNDNMLLAVF